ncbi:MAG: hypothetical protein PHS82_04655 [Lachnospiraceae bacterium]|nr:hypothetical protein [Lachnospiraceae bacterium]
MKKMNANKKQMIALILNLIVIVMEIIGAVMSARKHGAAMFQFYTEDSNIFALLACSIFAVVSILNLAHGKTEIPKWVHILKYIAACCLTVTFVVVICVLAPTLGPGGYTEMLLQGSMLYHHFLCPVLVVISFLFFERGPQLDKKCRFYAVIPTIIYAAASILLNILKVMDGPYPFLHVFEQPIYMSALWCAVILGGAYLFAWLIWKLNGKVRSGR